MKKILFKMAAIVVASSALLIASCDKSPNPTPVHSEEEIEQVNIYLIPYTDMEVETTDTIKIVVNESGEPSPSTIALQANTSYKLLLDPHAHEGSIAPEIADEGAAHQFFFIADPAAGITTYEYLDADANGHGIGLIGKALVGNEDFNLNILLRHGLDKFHPNAAAYNDANNHLAGGGEDINIVVPFTVE